MKSFDVQAVLKHRCNRMERYYTSLLEDFEMEEIHQFRLHIKKTKAFLALLNAGRTEGKEIRMTKQLRAFYDTVGGLRNLQLHKEEVLLLCNKLHDVPPPIYLQSLQKKETQAKAAARAMALQHSLQSSCSKLLEAAPKRIKGKDVERFVADHKHRLLKILLTGDYTDEELHAVRKLLKQVIYLWQWVETEVTALPRSACMDKDVCLALSEKLGDFQNYCITLRLFSTCLPGQPADDETSVLSKLCLFIQNEKQQLKKEIVTELQSCLQCIWEKDVLLPVYEYS